MEVAAVENPTAAAVPTKVKSPRPLLDEIGLATWQRARSSGKLTAAALQVFWSFLERDWRERSDHRGAQAWFSAHAPSVAEECHTKRHRVHGQVVSLTKNKFIAHKLRDKTFGTYRVWIRHSDQPVPDDVAPAPTRRSACPSRRPRQGQRLTTPMLLA